MIQTILCSTFQQWFSKIPPITKTLLVTYLASGILIAVGFFPTKLTFMSWSLVLFPRPIPQLWRLVTNFTVLGAPSLMYLFRMLWLVSYGGSYESSKFGHNTADAVTMIVFCMASTILIDAAVPMLRSSFHGPTLVFALLYLWSKQNPTAPVSLFGLIKLQALYLPFAFLAITLLQGASPKSDIMGILVGHLYYFLTDIYPLQGGPHLITTPRWLVRRFYKHRIGRVPDQRATAVNPSDVTFRPFSGTARRLTD